MAFLVEEGNIHWEFCLRAFWPLMTDVASDWLEFFGDLAKKKVLTPETNVLNVQVVHTFKKWSWDQKRWLCFQQSHRPPKPLFAYISFNKQCCVSIGKWLAVFDQCIFIRRKAIQWTQSLATWRLWAKFKNLTCKYYHVVTKCHSVGGDISVSFAHFNIFRKWHETSPVVGICPLALLRCAWMIYNGTRAL